MYQNSEEPEFPNWWDVLDESEKDRKDRKDRPNRFGEEVSDEVVLTSDLEGISPGSRRVSESPVITYSAETSRGYEREVIESVWNFAEIVAGNDPDLWRKDEWGNWLRRLDYGRRDSEFGWEIFDPGVGRHSQGVYAMRPMQWSRFLEQFEVLG